MKSLSMQSFALLLCFLLMNSNIFSQESGLKQTFQEMNNSMCKAVMENDMETANSFYSDDAVSLPSYEPMIKGKEAIVKKGKENHEAGFKMNQMSLQTDEVWSSGDLAVEIGTYNVSMTMPNMPEETKDNGKYLTVWQKQGDGSWKIKAETWNTDNNPWQTMQAQSGEEKMGVETE